MVLVFGDWGMSKRVGLFFGINREKESRQIGTYIHFQLLEFELSKSFCWSFFDN